MDPLRIATWRIFRENIFLYFYILDATQATLNANSGNSTRLIRGLNAAQAVLDAIQGTLNACHKVNTKCQY